MTIRLRMRTLAGAATLLAAAGLVAGCSSSKSSPSTSSSASSTPTPSMTMSMSPGETMPPSSSATGSGAPLTGTAAAAAKAQIAANYAKFFSKSTPIAEKAAVLENGSSMAATLNAFAKDPRVGQASAKVTNVTFTAADKANVTYAISIGNQVMLPNATGTAVLQDGVWKVSDATLCGLLTLSGDTSIHGCSA
jgi:ABC-type phosphate transport system substrate-binding protein